MYRRILPALFVGSFLLKPKFILASPKEEPKYNFFSKLLIFDIPICKKSDSKSASKYDSKYIQFFTKLQNKYVYLNIADFFKQLEILNFEDFPYELIDLFSFYNIDKSEFKGNIDNLSPEFKCYILTKFKLKFVYLNKHTTNPDPHILRKLAYYGLKIVNYEINKATFDFNNDEIEFLLLMEKLANKNYLYSFYIDYKEFYRLEMFFSKDKHIFYLPLEQIGKFGFECYSAVNDVICKKIT